MDARTAASQAHRDAAEEVRAHLVALRGAGLFLSSADSLLLVGWLDAGVSVADILRALERAAEARRRRKARVPLQLTHAKRHLGKSTKGVFAQERPVSREVPLDPVVRTLAVHADSPARQALEGALRGCVATDPDQLFRAAAAAVRTFLDARWDELPEAGREALRAKALAELGDLADLVDGDTREALVSEGARDLLRAGYPALSAASLWEAVEAGAHGT